MSPTRFRRLGAVLLLVVFLSGCTDPPLSPPADGAPGDAATLPENPYGELFAVLPLALARASRAAQAAASRGASRDEAHRAGMAAANALLRQEGLSDGGGFAAADIDGLELLTPGQHRYLREIESAIDGLGPDLPPAELESRLRRIERRAMTELSEAERQPVLMATAGVAAFWRANYTRAQLGLLPAGTALADLHPVDTFSWDGLARAVSKGIISGAAAGAAVGGKFYKGKGYVLGALVGAVGGAVGKGVGYVLDTLI